MGTVEKGTAHGRAHKEPLSPPPCVLPGPARGEPTQVRCGRHIPCARLQSEVSTCSPKDNFQLAWKQTSKCLLSIPALPKEFENNLFPDHKEILLLQEKERRGGEKRKHRDFPRHPNAVRSWCSAEGPTATINVNHCSEGGCLTRLLKVTSATAI